MTSLPIQNHIHLAASLSGAPEYSPIYTWKATKRILNPTIIAAPVRTLTGRLRKNVLSDSGSPMLFEDFHYTLVVKDEQIDDAWERIEILKAMLGKTVYLVDHYHQADGVNHTSEVRTMFFSRMGDVTGFTQTLIRYYVDIELTDNNY
jgi:hypothetical protein